MVSKIENIERFDDPKKLVSYCGLAPKVNESDGKRRGGKITGNTDAPLLRVIIQGAWAAVRFDKTMNNFYERLRIRVGKQKAIVAVARKMIVLVYYHLIKNKV